MTDEPRAAGVRFDDNRLVLEQYRDQAGIYYSFPGAAPDSFRADGRTTEGTSAALSLTEALHARIRPVGTAENVLRAWSQGVPAGHGRPGRPDDSRTDPGPRRRDRHPRPADATDPLPRGRRLPLRDPGRRRRSRRDTGGGGGPRTPGGDRPARNGRTRSGPDLAGRHPGPLLHDGGGRRSGRTGDPGQLRGAPAWVPVSELPTTPLWPRRLSWRIAHWHTSGWPAYPAELADTVWDLDAACGW